MIWIHLVILFAILQLFVFILMVGKARATFKVEAPAITGHDGFERYYRVQMNTIEMLVMFIPSILLAATYWSPYLMAILGVIYLIGRVLYFRAYVTSEQRTIPFLMGLIPVLIFLILGIFGSVRALINV